MTFCHPRAAAAMPRSCRRPLALCLLIGLCALAPGVSAQALRPTPPDDYGPFYPLDWSGEIDADLTSFAGRTAEGGVLRLSGQVLDTRRRPLANAVVEIWQTDARGRYRHPGVPEATRDRSFQGYGRVLTDAAGNYAFTTVLPGRYGGRPPHVHVRAAPPGQPEFVTQIYFRGDNREGGGAGRLPPEREALTVDLTASPAGGRAARFDIVVPAR